MMPLSDSDREEERARVEFGPEGSRSVRHSWRPERTALRVSVKVVRSQESSRDCTGGFLVSARAYRNRKKSWYYGSSFL